jgi:glutamine phosphoribosylpyrophosphate amidotransferase
VARRRALPDDIVIAAVPSSGDLTADMAARVGSALGRPVERLLGVRGGLLGRLDGSVRGRIKAKTRSMPRHVLLVDDSVRSGDTLKACAQLVRHRGAEQVWAVVAAAMLDFDGADPISW